MPDVDRKLAAILSADVVGYSRLMADDEAATIRTLGDSREAIELFVRQHRGRVVDTPGDNVLADFPTALDAVRGALEIQSVMRARNAQLPAERRMEFRIGVHMGDVAVEGERLYGDGVNIAARLEALADTGGICISATVHEQVRNKLGVGFTDLGDQTVKNIPDQVHVYRVQPVASDAGHSPAVAPTPGRRTPRAVLVAAAGLLALLAIGLWASWPAPLGLLVDLGGIGEVAEPPLPDKPSVVVLPFENMTGDPDQEHFADGITEELTADLAGSPQLLVISRASAFSYKGRQVRVEEVGRELGVRYVVEGSVRRSGNRVRVTAQLIDAGSSVHIWSQQLDRDLEDIFAVQSEISEAILGAVGIEVREAELARIRRRPTQDLSAYEAYTKAFSLFLRFRRADHAEAQRLLERALELDPGYAEAWSLLAGTYTSQYNLGWSDDPALLDRGRELTERALSLDPSLALAQVNLASIAAAEGNARKIIEHSRRGIELAPSFSAPYAFLAVGLSMDGQPLEALQALGQMSRLEPRAGVFGMTTNLRAGFFRQVGRVDEAVELWERAREANPDLLPPRLELIAHYVDAGRAEEASALVQEVLLVDPDFSAGRARRFGSGRSAEELAEYEASLRRAGLP